MPLYVRFTLLLALFAIQADAQRLAPKSQFALPTIAQSEAAQAGNRIQTHRASQVTRGRTDILFQRVKVNVNPAQANMSGSVLTKLRALAPQDTLYFDLSSNMTVDSVKYRGQRKVADRSVANLVIIPLGVTIATNAVDSIEVFYKGSPANNNGFGSYIRRLHNGVPILWTLSEPYGARDWWPCKQDLKDKIDRLEFWVRTPQGQVAASNGLLYESNSAVGFTTFKFRHNYPITAYLVCFAVTNFQKQSYKVKLASDSLKIENFLYPESYAQGSVDALQVNRIIQVFDSIFGPYPFAAEKYGHTQFSWGGGMEHQTNSFMSNFSYELIAHELAHQWFGNKITCGRWSEIWLNEGFATYSESIAYEVSGNRLGLENWKEENLNAARASTNGSVFCNDTTSVGRIFDGRLTYAKGAYLLRMLRYNLGDSAFFAGVRNYVADASMAYKFSSTSILQRKLEQASGRSLTRFFNNWYLGNGYPILNISWVQPSADSLFIRIDQTGTDVTSPVFETDIPLKVNYFNGNEMFRVKISQPSQVIKIANGRLVRSILFDPDRWIVARATVTQLTATARSLTKSRVMAYPNPAQRRFSLSGADLKSIRSVQALALDGRVLRKWLPATEYDLSGIAAQAILLKVVNQNGVTTQLLRVE